MTLGLTAIGALIVFVLWKWTGAKTGHLVAAIVATVLLYPLIGDAVRSGVETVASVAQQLAASIG